MDVPIIETKTGKPVGTIPIILHGMNDTPTEQEYFAEAWRCGSDDRTVDPARP